MIAWRDAVVGVAPALALLWHPPNAASRSPWARGRLLEDGMSAGVPDLWLPVARHGYHGCVVEMKRRRGRGLTPRQRWWLLSLHEQGWYCVVARGADEAIRHLAWYCGLQGGFACS